MSSRAAFVKRAVDLAVALPAIAAVLPVFLLIGLIIKIDSRGTVFFRQERVGKDMTRFRIWKFRTMIAGAYRSGARLTVNRDPRITQVGQLLRWTKLDELPQLLNVIAGDMSLVGPRPEDPHFVSFYTEAQKQVLSVKPGLIGPSQIDGRDEVEKYPEGLGDTERFYVDHILPEKLARDLEYVRTASIRSDISFLVGGVLHVVSSQFKGSFFARIQRRLALLGMDLCLIVGSYVLANLMHFEGRLPAQEWPYITATLFWSLLLKPPIFIYYGLYQRATRWVERGDLVAIVKAVSLSSGLVIAVTFFTGMQGHSRAVFLEDWALLIVLMSGCRLVLGHVLNRVGRTGDTRSHIKVLVAGSGHGGQAILRALLEDPRSRFLPVGIIDHEPHRWGALIHGVRVMGGAADIATAAATRGVGLMLVSLADLDPSVVRDISEACKKHDIQCRLIPTLSDVLTQQQADVTRMTPAPDKGGI